MATEILLIVLVAALFVLTVLVTLHQWMLFARLIRQNNTLMEHADKRLDRANQIVHDLLQQHTETTNTLAHSADSLSASITQIKDMMVHLEKVYTERNTALSNNYEQLNNAHIKLTERYIELENKYEEQMQRAYDTLQELARRPTTTNNNTNNMGE